MPPSKKHNTASASLFFITFLVERSLCKTQPATPDHLYFQWPGGEQSNQRKQTVNVNNNILNSVNDIFDSFDDEYILNSMVEDIVKPVIQEAIVRKEDQEREYEEKVHDGEIFTKHRNIRRRPELYHSDRLKYRYPPTQLDRDYPPAAYSQSRYGQRLRRGLARLASSAPVWQQFLQLLAAGLLVFLLPGVFIG